MNYSLYLKTPEKHSILLIERQPADVIMLRIKNLITEELLIHIATINPKSFPLFASLFKARSFEYQFFRMFIGYKEEHPEQSVNYLFDYAWELLQKGLVQLCDKIANEIDSISDSKLFFEIICGHSVVVIKHNENNLI